MSQAPSAPSDLPSRQPSLIAFVWYKRIGERRVVAFATEEGLARCAALSNKEIVLFTSRPVRVRARLFVEMVTAFGSLSLVGRIRVCEKQESAREYRMLLDIEIVPPNHRDTLARTIAARNAPRA